MKTSYRLDIITPYSFMDQTLGLLAARAAHGWEEKQATEGIVFSVHAGEKKFLEELAAKVGEISADIKFQIIEYEDKPWSIAWKEFFKPIPVRQRFLIVPPWLKEEDAGGRIKIIIEPEFAFGTGHHATTILCLRALDDLLSRGVAKAGMTFLDLGSGSGILGIAAAMSGLKGLCLDIDPLATINGEKNAGHNRATDARQLTGGLELARNRKFDLILANILANPLKEMAPELTDCLGENGRMILSGILDNQADAVAEAYENENLEIMEILSDGEWRALCLARRRR